MTVISAGALALMHHFGHILVTQLKQGFVQETVTVSFLLDKP